MSLSFSISLSNTALLEQTITRHCIAVIRRAIEQAIPYIRGNISALIEKAIFSTPEYEALLHGTLKAQLGLIDGKAMMNPIVEALKDNIDVELFPFPSGSSKVSNYDILRISFIQRDHQDLLALSNASYMSHQYRIDWLEWLLKKGDGPIVADYIIKYGDFTTSRSKMALMAKSVGGSWQVIPSEFSGKEGDNFITRAFEGADHIILDIIKDAIIARIN